MFSLKRETKIGGSRTGVSAALALTRGSLVKIGTCVVNFSLFLHVRLSPHLSVPALQSPPCLLSGAAATVHGATDPSPYTPARLIDALTPNITPCWSAAATDAVITILRRSHRFRRVPSNGRICEFRQRRGARVTP